MRADSPSSTAMMIAGATVFASFDAALRGHIPDGAVEWSENMLRQTRGGRALLRSVRSRWGRSSWRMVEAWTHPGIVAHFIRRKCWIEEAWRSAELEGFDHLVTLGSGYDTLSLRRSERGEAAVAIDVDHPATLRVRTAAVRERGMKRPPVLIAHDLGTPGIGAVLTSVVPPGARVFVVAEGLFMYLSGERVAGVLNELRGVPCQSMRLLFTFMEHGAGATPAFRPASRLVNWWLALRGEPFRWGLERERVAVWLKVNAWKVCAYTSAPGWDRALPPRLTGESAAIADRE